MPFINTTLIAPTEVIPGYEARAVHTGSLTLLYWTVQEGAAMPLHSHLHEQIAHVLEGKFELIVNGETKLLDPGTIAVIPPFATHGGKAITACRLLDVFYPERDDYKFDQQP